MQRKSIKGFTLVEVLVAMAVFLTIVFPFLSAYVLSNKINQQSFYIKRATDVLEIAQEDIQTWEEDILEVIAGKQWKYLNTKNGPSMHVALRKLLDDKDVEDISIDGVPWGEGLDVFFEITKDTALGGTLALETNEPDALRSGYDLFIRVSKDGVKITPKGDTAISLSGTDLNNSQVGYYMDVTLGDSNSSYKILKVPSSKYLPLEKLAGNKKVLFGGREWYTLYNATAGDVGVICIPRASNQYISKPFDVTEGLSNPRFKQATSNSWQNIAFYLNNEFYNSLIYSEYLYDENYYTNRNWIKKHTWQIGQLNNEVSQTTVENVGLLRKNEVNRIMVTIPNKDAYTLTPQGNVVYLMDDNTSAPNVEKYIYPVIYLDKDLYCKINDTEGYRLYEATTNVFKKDITDSALTLLGTKNVSGSEIKIMVYFDKDLPETNFDSKHYEKLRFLVNVTDGRTTNKTADGLTIYTINNKDMGNYKWLNIKNANKTTDFKVVDSMYLEEDYKGNTQESTELLRKFKVNGYTIKVWAEYMAPDEYRGNNAYKNEHEKLILYINKEKDVPTFDYKVSAGTSKEGDNIDNTIDLDSVANKKYRR